MLLITAVVRPEKTYPVLNTLADAGYYGMSRWDVVGRGKEKGITVGEVNYEEMPKSMLYLVVDDEDKDAVVDLIIHSAQSGESGNAGDGRIFVSPITESYTISSSEKD